MSLIFIYVFFFKIFACILDHAEFLTDFLFFVFS